MNAYGTDAEFQVWMTSQGLALPPGAPPLVVLRQIGSNYIDAAYEHALSCSRRAGGFEQLRAWPRVGHYMRGVPVPPDLVPPAWIQASYRAAYLAATNPGWGTGTTDANRVTKREKVDVIEREFFAPGDAGGADSAAGVVSDALINGMVLPWLCANVRDANSLFFVI